MQPEELKNNLTEKALLVYRAPFRYECGYIFDAEGKMAADEGGSVESSCRVRGWGRLQYMKDVDPAKLQDHIGVMIAESMTSYWKMLKSEGAPPKQTVFDLFCLRHPRRDETVYWDGAGSWTPNAKEAAMFTSWERAHSASDWLSKALGIHHTPIITMLEATE